MAELAALAMAAFSLWITRLLWRRFDEFRSLGRPAAGPAGGRQPRVTAIVPARNEERNIRACLTALLAQNYPDFEVIALDDQSTDRTPEIIEELAADPRLRAVTAPPLPPGWKGKCHTLWAGARLAGGEWLFFVDADTFVGPDLLAAAVAYAEARQLDVISVLPGQELRSLGEHIVQPVVFAVLQLFLPPGRSNDPRDPMGHVAGQCLGIRRAAYEATGGHSHPAVRDSFAEDVMLGQMFKAAGRRLELVAGSHLAQTRMYTTLDQVWNGWARLALPGLGDRWYLLPLAVFAIVGTAAYFAAALGPGLTANAPAWVGALNGLTLAYLLLFLGFLRWKIGRLVGQPTWHTLTYPLGLVIVTGIGLAAILRSLLGLGTEFRGRRYG